MQVVFRRRTPESHGIELWARRRSLFDPLGLGLAFSWAGQVGFLVASSVVTIKTSLGRHSYGHGGQHEPENREGSARYEKASYR
jgi:hypothetical protein